MAAMYGRIEWYGDRTCGCCWVGKSKRQQRRIERKQWIDDFRQEVDHEDPVFPPGYDHYPEGAEAWPENLAGIKGVTYTPAF